MSASLTEHQEIDLGDLAPVEVRFRISGQPYVLQEATEAAVATWERHRINSRSYDENGTFAGLKPQADDLSSLLLSMCLLRCEARDTGEIRKPVPLTEPLVKKCKEISDLDKAETADIVRKEIAVLQRRLAKLEGEGAPKNGQSGGAGSSASATN